ncbi:MAG: hypothetical protein JO108_36030 [Acidobacteriaceae bacterium]|nr:hypothetical protein [Acidobacteriaceae bacterium]
MSDALSKMPGGARQQLTFFTEPVHGGTYHPNGGDYVVFLKDAGGEWYQLFRYDAAAKLGIPPSTFDSKNQAAAKSVVPQPLTFRSC